MSAKQNRTIIIFLIRLFARNGESRSVIVIGFRKDVSNHLCLVVAFIFSFRQHIHFTQQVKSMNQKLSGLVQCYVHLCTVCTPSTTCSLCTLLCKKETNTTQARKLQLDNI